MPELETPLKQAYEYAPESYMQSSGITRYLLQALETLPQSETELRSAIEQMIARTEELTAIYEQMLPDIFRLYVTYQALQSPSQESSSDVHNLLRTLARIEASRQSEKQTGEQ